MKERSYELLRDHPISELKYDYLNPRLAPREVGVNEPQEQIELYVQLNIPHSISVLERYRQDWYPPEEPLLAVAESGLLTVIDGNCRLSLRRVILGSHPEEEHLERIDVAVYASRSAAYPAQAERNFRPGSYWNAQARERFIRRVTAYHNGDIEAAGETMGIQQRTITGHLAAGNLLERVNPGRQKESMSAVSTVRRALEHPKIVRRLGLDPETAHRPDSPAGDLEAQKMLVQHLTGVPRLFEGPDGLRQLAAVYGSDSAYRRLLSEHHPRLEQIHKELTRTNTETDLREEARRLEHAGREALEELREERHPATIPYSYPTCQAVMQVAAEGTIPLLTLSSPAKDPPPELAEAVQRKIRELLGIECLVK